MPGREQTVGWADSAGGSWTALLHLFCGLHDFIPSFRILFLCTLLLDLLVIPLTNMFKF